MFGGKSLVTKDMVDWREAAERPEPLLPKYEDQSSDPNTTVKSQV